MPVAFAAKISQEMKPDLPLVQARPTESMMSEPIDYSKTLNLPQTDFPMRAGLPEAEPKIIARWHEMDLYKRLREDAEICAA
jgi:hypothetical protein